MKKNEICKTIINSIQSYISSPECLAAHRFPNHFIRKRKLSLQHVVMYLLYSSKASMYQNLASIFDDLGSDFFLLFRNKLCLNPEKESVPLFFRNYLIFLLIFFIKMSSTEKPGMVITSLLLMVPDFNFLIQKVILTIFVKCSARTTITKSFLWPYLL